MRAASRLLASVKPGRFLEPNSPTGLTGLFTHPAPRSTLIYLYSSTLDKLKGFPESSAYRQSTEALTRHRLKIVDSVKPAGYESWVRKAKARIAEHPEVFNTAGAAGGKSVKTTRDGRQFVTTQLKEEADERVEEWDGEKVEAPELEGTRTSAERAYQKNIVAEQDKAGLEDKVAWEAEPPLDASQVAELENQIGAGLIEEVIQVAEGELKLADTLLQAKVWEELEEKPLEGQWTYFERGSHTNTTQKP